MWKLTLSKILSYIYKYNLSFPIYIKQALQIARTKLKNIDTKDLDCKVILSYITKTPHYEFISNPKQTINLFKFIKYMNLIKRRIKEEPVAYLIKEKEFYNNKFIISKDVLIPRADSETLIDAVKDTFRNKDKYLNILDMGTGSGCLLLSLLKLYNNAKGIGIDINNKALNIAFKNAKLLNLTNKIKLKKYSWNKKNFFKPINQKFDIIISNPPYISYTDKKISKSTKQYEPYTALFAKQNGLAEYINIKKAILNWKILKNNGFIFLEIGKNQEKKVVKIFTDNNNNNIKYISSYKDIAKITRILKFQYHN